MTDQLTLEDLIDQREPAGMTGRARPAISEAEMAACACPEMCPRDHENE